MSSCEICLDDPRGLYFSGNNLTGSVKCIFNHAENIEGVKITLTGSEYTTWTEWTSRKGHRHIKKRKRRPVHYRGSNDFLVVDTTLTGAGDIRPGCLEYQFSIDLPPNIPSTYNGKYGWVKYVVKATVARPNQNEYQSEKEVKMVSLVNFNDIKYELQLQPVSYSEEKKLYCWCCSSGPIEMVVRLEKQAFVVGETVKVMVDLTNGSREKIDMVVVEIGMAVISKVTSPSSHAKQDYELLAKSRQPGLNAHRSKYYSFALEIPPTSGVNNFQGCTLFTQQSTVKVTAVLSTYHQNIKLPVDIVVGHVPIGGDIEQYQRRIIDQASHLMPSLPLSDTTELPSPDSATSEPPVHIILPSRIPPPFPNPNVELHPPLIALSCPSPPASAEVNPPPLDSNIPTPGVSVPPPSVTVPPPGSSETTESFLGVAASGSGTTNASQSESPPPSYEDATRRC